MPKKTSTPKTETRSTTSKRSPFDYVSAINSRKDIVRTGETAVDDAIKDYNPFLTNRALSYHQDTINVALKMNVSSDLSKIMQYDFLINIVRPRARFGKWGKPIVTDQLEMVSQYFDVNYDVAQQYLRLLSPEVVEQITRTMNDSGGVTNG